MQLSARYNAVLELTEEIFKDKSPADGIINAYLRERKYIGSGDPPLYCRNGMENYPAPPAAGV